MSNNGEIEGSQPGAALTADFAATPYSLTGLSSFISDLNYIVSNHKENPTHHSKTWVMCVSSLNWIMGLVNKHLPIYINDLKQGRALRLLKSHRDNIEVRISGGFSTRCVKIFVMNLFISICRTMGKN